MWHTHAAISASTLWLLLPFLSSNNSVNIGGLAVCAVIGASVPDLDAAQSKIRHFKVVGLKPFIPLATAIHCEFGHRGLLHSLLGLVFWAGWLLPFIVWIGWLPAAALVLGYASHLAGDACTPSGIPAFYPKRRKLHLLSRSLRVTTGSETEEVLFVVFATSSVFLLLSLIHL